MQNYSNGIPVFLLVISLLASTAGCGGNTSKAQDFMHAGDNLINDIKDECVELEGLGAEMNGIVEAVFTGEVPPSKDIKEKLNEFSTCRRKIEKNADKAVLEYRKILSLDDVPLYSKYSGKAIEYLETVKELLKEYQDLLDYLTGTLEQHESGVAVDSTAFSADLQNSFNEMELLGSEAEKINEERSRLKKENGL